MNGKHPRFGLRNGGWRYLLAVCAASTTLASGLHSVFAQELEDVVVADSRSSRDTNATPSQALSENRAEMLSSTRSSDIADILNDNPLLLSSVSTTTFIDSEVANDDNTEIVGGSTLGLRGLGY